MSNDRPVAAAKVLQMRFILPEPDASRRRQFDEWCFRATQKSFDVVLEAGGWQTILDFVEEGIGVGLVPETAVDEDRQHGTRDLTTRKLGENEFPADAVRLIARKAHGNDKPELIGFGNRLRQLRIEQSGP